MKDLLLFDQKSGVFFTSPEVGQENRLNFGEDLFFFGDHLILTEKPPQSDSRLVKSLVKFVCCCFQLPKKGPPFANSWLTRLVETRSSLEREV